MKPKKDIKDILANTDTQNNSLDLSMGSIDLSTDSLNLFGDEGGDEPKVKPEPFEKEMKKEAGAMLSLIREKEKAWQESFNMETTLDFYISIVWKSPQEMHAWLDKRGLKPHYGNHLFIDELEESFRKHKE